MSEPPRIPTHGPPPPMLPVETEQPQTPRGTKPRAKGEVGAPVEWQGYSFNHVRQRLGMPGPPPRMPRPAPRPGSRQPSKTTQAPDQNDTSWQSTDDIDAQRGRGKSREEAPEAESRGNAENDSNRDAMQYQDGDSAADATKVSARPDTRMASREIDAMDYLRRSRIPGTEVLFPSDQNAPLPDRKELLEALAATALSVLRKPPQGARTPSQTALMLAGSQAAMERMQRTDRPPESRATMSEVKEALLVAMRRVPPATEPPSLQTQMKYAVLPVLLHNLMHRPRPPGQHDRANGVMRQIRRTRQFCEPAPTPVAGAARS